MLSARWWSLCSGVGITKSIAPVPFFPNFPALLQHTLAIEDHVYFWQVSPQLSCGDACQIWMRFNEFDSHFCKIEHFS